MGAAISNNVASQIISQSYKIATAAVTTCQSSSRNNFTIGATGSCTVEGNTIDFTQGNTISATCLQNLNVQNSIKSQINAQIIAQSNAAAQSLGGPSLSYAQAVQDVAEDASTTISNAFTVNCISGNTNTANITCGDNASISNNVINVNQTNSTYATCTNDAATITRLAQSLSSAIQSTTTATEADTLSGVIVILFVFLAIGAIFFLYTLNGPTGWIVVGIVALIIIALLVYAAFAFTDGLYPFKKTA